jgi:hypothetical protein
VVGVVLVVVVVVEEEEVEVVEEEEEEVEDGVQAEGHTVKKCIHTQSEYTLYSAFASTSTSTGTS